MIFAEVPEREGKGDKKNSKIKGILNENLRTRFDDTLATRADSSLPSSSTKMYECHSVVMITLTHSRSRRRKQLKLTYGREGSKLCPIRFQSERGGHVR